MNLQTLTGIHLSGAGVPLAGRAVKAMPLPEQHIDDATVDTQALTLTDVTDENGAWSLTLLQGVVYHIKIAQWGLKTIRVTADAEKQFAAYLGDNATLAGPTVGSIKIGNRYIVPTLTDADGNPVEMVEGQSLEGLTLGWEII